MAYKDLDTFFDPDLHLPIRGKRYTVPAPEWEEVKRLRRIVGDDGIPPVEQFDDALRMLGATPVLDDKGAPTGDWSGGVFSEMVDDKIPWTMILHCGRTAICHYGFNADIAEIHWGMEQLGKYVDLEDATEIVGKFMARMKSKQ